MHHPPAEGNVCNYINSVKIGMHNTVRHNMQYWTKVTAWQTVTPLVNWPGNNHAIGEGKMKKQRCFSLIIFRYQSDFDVFWENKKRTAVWKE